MSSIQKKASPKDLVWIEAVEKLIIVSFKMIHIKFFQIKINLQN